MDRISVAANFLLLNIFQTYNVYDDKLKICIFIYENSNPNNNVKVRVKCNNSIFLQSLIVKVHTISTHLMYEVVRFLKNYAYLIELNE